MPPSDDPAAPRRTPSRRGLVVFAAIGAAALAAPPLLRRLTPLPGLEPHPDLPGFRRLQAGAVTGAADPLAGLDGRRDDGIAPAAVADLCAALFRDGRMPGRVPVAFFTDINCPYCRVMEPWLEELGQGPAAVSVHDLPLLGPGSQAAARAIVAAGEQGAAAEMRARLHRTRFRADAGYIAALADGLGLDADRLLADMQAPATTARIAQSLGLAARLGIFGTPGLVSGDIVALGRRSRADLARILRAAGPPPCA